MNSDEVQGKLPESLVTAIIIHIFIGWGFLQLATLSVKHLTYNGYMSILPALIFILPAVFIAVDLARLFPGEDMTLLFRHAFGKVIGFFCTISIIVWLALIVTFIIRESQLMVVTYFFKTTPSTLVISLFWIVCLYLALHGIQACGRMAGFMLVPPLIIIYGLVVLGLFNMSPLNIQPMWTGTLGQWSAGGWDLVFVLAPAGALFFYLPFIQNPKRMKRVGLISLAVITPLFFLSILGTIGAFGIAVIPKMTWPTVEFFHIIDYPFLLLEQAGLLFLLAWYGFVIVTVGQGLFQLGFLFNRILPQLHLRWCTLILGVAVFFLSILPLNPIEVDNLIEKSRGYSNIYILSLFAITWLVLRIKIGRRGNHAGTWS